jgi:hypothetical protein
MKETPRETCAAWIGLFVTLIPAMIVSGFMPDWNVLPVGGWVAIATIGAGISGAIATPLTARGALCGAMAGAGALGGMWLYAEVRSALTGSNTFMKLELVIAGLLGGLPGLLLYNVWARPRRRRQSRSKDMSEEVT